MSRPLGMCGLTTEKLGNQTTAETQLNDLCCRKNTLHEFRLLPYSQPFRGYCLTLPLHCLIDGSEEGYQNTRTHRANHDEKRQWRSTSGDATPTGPGKERHVMRTTWTLSCPCHRLLHFSLYGYAVPPRLMVRSRPAHPLPALPPTE